MCARGQSWHADLCVYLACLYTVYYIWLCQVWRKIFPELHFNMDLLRMKQEKTEKLNNKSAPIGMWGPTPAGEEEKKPNDQVRVLSFTVVASGQRPSGFFLRSVSPTHERPPFAAGAC